MSFISLKNRVGESLLEAIIAVFVVTTSVTVALSVLTTNVDTTAANKQFLIADNLALEAIEAGNNIIQTNYLRFGVDVNSNCWLVFPQANVNNDQCDTSLIVEEVDPDYEGQLQRKYDNTARGPQLKWQLSEIERTLDLAQGDEANKMFTVYEAKLPNLGSTYYTNESTDNPSGFFRSIRFERIDQKTVNLIAKVQWRQRGRIVTVTKKRTLTNG